MTPDADKPLASDEHKRILLGTYRHGRMTCLSCQIVARVMREEGAEVACPRCGGSCVPSPGVEDYGD